MPISTDRLTEVSWLRRFVFYCGIAVFVSSFFLPALGNFSGWACAFLSLLLWKDHDDKFPRILLFGAALNFEVLLFIMLLGFRQIRQGRALLAIVILFSIPMTWIALHRMANQIVVNLRLGHFLWVAGILLVVLPDLPDCFSFASVRWLTAAALLTLGCFTLPLLIGLTMHRASARDDFLYVVAWTLKEPSACGKIDGKAIGREDQRNSADFTYMQSDCYRNAAAKAGTPELCNHVKSAGLDRLIGSLVSKAMCRRQGYTQGTAMPGTGPAFVEEMRAAGFGDDQLAGALYRQRPDNYVDPILDRLRGDPEFLKRLQASANFKGFLNKGQLRPAEPLEIVDQMVAIMGDLPALCDKISPNSQGMTLAGYPDMVRASCYSNIAFNRRQDGLCRKLPSAANFQQSWQGGYQEGCQKNVQMLRDPKSNLGWGHYGPAVYPTWPQFQTAMQQLGYPRDAELLQLPRPTAEAYSDYLFYLVAPERKAERDEFVRLVLAMP